MKRTAILIAVSLCLLNALSSESNASILGNLLSFNGIEDTLIDESRSNFHNNDGSMLAGVPTFTVGDVIEGIVAIDQVDADSDNLGLSTVDRPDEVVFLFSAQIGSIIGDSLVSGTFGTLDPGEVANLVPTTFAGLTLTDLLHPAIAASIVRAPEAIFVTVEGSTPADALDEGTFTSLSDFSPANGLSYVATGGIDATVGGNPHGDADFFHFSLTGLTTIIGFEDAGLTLFDTIFGPGVDFLPVTATRQDSGAITKHDTSLFNGTVENLGASSAWDFSDNSNFKINPTPEPTAFVIWGLLVCGGMGFASRRRQRSA